MQIRTYSVGPFMRSRFCSFCRLLFGDPLPPPTTDVIYGSPQTRNGRRRRGHGCSSRCSSSTRASAVDITATREAGVVKTRLRRDSAYNITKSPVAVERLGKRTNGPQRNKCDNAAVAVSPYIQGGPSPEPGFSVPNDPSND